MTSIASGNASDAIFDPKNMRMNWKIIMGAKHNFLLVFFGKLDFLVAVFCVQCLQKSSCIPASRCPHPYGESYRNSREWQHWVLCNQYRIGSGLPFWCKGNWPFPLALSQLDDLQFERLGYFTLLQLEHLGAGWYGSEWIGDISSSDSLILFRSTLVRPRWPSHINSNSDSILIKSARYCVQSSDIFPSICSLFSSWFGMFHVLCRRICPSKLSGGPDCTLWIAHSSPIRLIVSLSNLWLIFSSSFSPAFCTLIAFLHSFCRDSRIVWAIATFFLLFWTWLGPKRRPNVVWSLSPLCNNHPFGKENRLFRRVCYIILEGLSPEHVHCPLGVHRFFLRHSVTMDLYQR